MPIHERIQEDGETLILSWASIIDEKTKEQAKRTARLPFVIKPVALMSDSHFGMGATVGSVIGTQGAIIPSAIGVDIGCLDADTEFLTPTGWKKICDFDNDQVLGYDPQNDITEFASPLAYIQKDYEWLYKLKSNKGLDQVVSPDHKMLFFKGVKARGFTPEEYNANDLVAKHESLKKGLQGGFKTAFTHNPNSSGVWLSCNEIRIQVMIAADGCLRKRKTLPNSVEMHLCKERKINRCIELLEKSQITYAVNYAKDGSVFINFVPPVWSKDLTFLYGAAYDQLQIASDEAIFWDGSEKTIDGTTRKFYCSTNKSNADVIQFCFAATGTRARIYRQTYENKDWKDCYFVIPTKNQYVGIPVGDIEKVQPLDGKAYCFTMQTGFFVARRNNNIFITGNCGIGAIETNLSAQNLPDNLEQFLPIVEATIPAGVGQGNSVASTRAYYWLQANVNKFTSKLDSSLTKKLLEQFGSLGSGNHFFEVCLDERDIVWLMLHSGSRGLGNILASRHIKDAKDLMEQKGIKLEDKDLAYFEDNDEGFSLYIGDMLTCQDYAKENRNLMLQNVFKAFSSFLSQNASLELKEISRINCHHNFTQKEIHDEREIWVTRKGAIKASVGDMGVIPGSMGTKSYVVRGLGEPISYESSSHGAGRIHSRSEAKRLFTNQDLERAMQGKIWLKEKSTSLLDEIPSSYKSIEQVMEDQKDLVSTEHELSQILNYKGC